MMTLRSTTRIAIQATLAVGIAELLVFFLQLERSYWAALTAVFLISQTWGESLKRAIERVVMTIVGGLAGTLLYFLLPHSPYLILAILLISVFFSVFFLEISYLAATFFITVFVVFLFALIGEWSLSILKARIIETLIGAVIATGVSLLILPVHGHKKLPALFGDFTSELNAYTKLCFMNIHKDASATTSFNDRSQLNSHHVTVRNQAKLINYELILSRYSKRHFDFVLNQFGLLTHYLTSLLETSVEFQADTTLRPDLLKAQDVLDNNFRRLKGLLTEQETNLETKSLERINKRLTNTINQSVQEKNKLESTWWTQYSYLYFMRKTNDTLKTLINFLD